MNPDDVLRKVPLLSCTSAHFQGTGTLCESLLMVEAKMKNIIFPDKQGGGGEKFYKG